MNDKVTKNDNNSALRKTNVRRSLNILKEILLFIILLPLLIMLDMMGMDVFSDD